MKNFRMQNAYFILIFTLFTIKDKTKGMNVIFSLYFLVKVFKIKQQQKSKKIIKN